MEINMTAAAHTRTLTFSGRGIGRGSAAGRLRFIKKKPGTARMPERRRCGANEETVRLQSAMKQASGQMRELYSRTLREAGESEAQIFEIHRMLLDDEDLFEEAQSLILDGYSAEYSIMEAADKYGSVFAAMEDEYLSARAADLRDVATRVAGILSGIEPEKDADDGSKYIVAADDLSPSETVQLNRAQILGFVTFGGSPNSHTAILARALGIPALIGTGNIDASFDGGMAVVDADKGLLYINPDEKTLGEYKNAAKDAHDAHERMNRLKGERSVTRGGREIRLYANIGSPNEALLARENDAEGIGLLRSEFLYLGSQSCPDEETLFTAYKRTLEYMGGREVVIRTIDIGADKKIDYFNLPREENPALGLRGIRLALARRDIFRTQLRAICRASAFGKVSVMLPMIVSTEEIKESRALLREVQDGLDARGVRFDRSIELGIMIETPAAAVMSAELAKEADFFSVGTNDLLQYTLAADRQNPDVADICERNREPVLRLIKMAADNAHSAGIWIGICGELAADTSLTECFAAMGIDELSVSPPYILPVRERIRGCT